MIAAPSLRSALIFTVFVLAGLSLGCGKSPAPEETPSPAPVKWMEARQVFLEEWTELLGTTQPLPDHAARITAPVEGRVLSLLKDAEGKPVLDAEGQPLAEGRMVKEGTPIVRLDDAVARANRDRVDALVKESSHHTRQAELAVKLAEIDVRRLTELSPGGGGIGTLPLVSRIELEKAQVVLDDARAKLKGAEAGHLAVEKELQQLNEQLKLYTLTAPISGRLGRLLVVQGQTLPPGSPVAEIADLEKEIDLLCFVPPRIARRLKEGHTARMGGIEELSLNKVPPSEGRDGPGGADEKPVTAEGHVVFIADQAETDTGNFAVKVRFPNHELKLRANTTLRVSVATTPGRACAFTLAESALSEDQNPPTVIVVENYKEEKTTEGGKEKVVETGTARKLRVKVGLRDRVKRQVEILALDDPDNKWKGMLDDTTKFVVERGQGLRNGDAMKLEVEDEAEEEMKAEKP